MIVPDDVRDRLRRALWERADRLEWMRLSLPERSMKYAAWARDSEIGGVLSNYMDQRRGHIYIKDTIMKGYVRERLADPTVVLRVLRMDGSIGFSRRYERPHGRRLEDGREIAWSTAKDWKVVFMAVHERAFGDCGARPYGAVLQLSTGRFADGAFRTMAGDAAARLGIEKVVWLS